ncbi:hypothetical protein [Hymenobacter properus]|uniref:Uncharacterized protein n=1 Tax=Hymenobacter properus TaxID=2791026 RepID=A0A931BIY3_9BACT|nr:hypothetical protein [Hymenobacter properus]MBF9144514.1 hypothetical protein [Hymenobacter properus]MBR7723332.1 hypothetical protein [Microvirga sp. SRT04]
MEEHLEGVPNRVGNLHAVLRELEMESDRGVAILGVSMLDQRLLELLHHLFVPCSQTKQLLSGPISSFANRLNLAMATGLIAADEYAECNRLRAIRNDFAHKFELDFSFSNEQVKKRCEKLEMFYEPDGEEELPDDNPEAEEQFESEITPRELFIKSVAEVYVCWLIREFHTQHRRMKRSGMDDANEYLKSQAQKQ